LYASQQFVSRHGVQSVVPGPPTRDPQVEVPGANPKAVEQSSLHSIKAQFWSTCALADPSGCDVLHARLQSSSPAGQALTQAMASQKSMEYAASSFSSQQACWAQASHSASTYDTPQENFSGT
jgi:hypothetical protein